MFSLTSDQSKKVITYFKTKSQWNVESRIDSLSLIPPDILFDVLEIFPLEFKDSQYLYDFNIFSVENFFNNTLLETSQKVKSLNCYSQISGKLIYSKLLGSFTSNGLLKIALTNGLDHENKIPLSESMVEFIQGIDSIKDYYHFNLSGYKYFIEDASLYDYLILDTEDLFLDQLTHLPLRYIDG